MATSSVCGAALAIAMLLTSPAAANPPAAAPAGAKADPANEVVCERQEVIGSRLATKRECHTRAQWADQRLQERQNIERAQTQRGSCDAKACQ